MKTKLLQILHDRPLEAMTFLIIALQPVLDLDYLIYPMLNQIGLPRPSTIIRFLIIPILILWAWLKKDQNKKRTFVFSAIYIAVLAVYFILHCKNAAGLYERLNLTTNFEFVLSYEFTYCFTLVIPYFIIYLIYQCNWKEAVLKKITLITSAVISIPIVISDIFLFGKSTYVGMTAASIFSWFNDSTYELFTPREVACKFFFEEGNTTGIVLFMILPLLYYFLSRENTKKGKILTSSLIVFHSLAMLMLSTRVAAYGAALVPLTVFLAYIFLCLIKKERFQGGFVAFVVILTVMNGAIIPHSPAYQNQLLNNSSVQLVLEDDDLLQAGKNELKGKGLVPGTTEYNYECIYIFEDWGIKSNLISTLPEVYYLEFYHYKFDAPFWVDILFEYPFSVRCSGREFERAFQQYKWQNLTSAEKCLGMGYSTFMKGSILLEADFEQQIYSYGYLGAILTVFPWIVILVGVIVVVLIHWKKMFTFKIFMLIMSLSVGLLSGYMSGHTLDEFMSIMVLATVSSFLIKETVLLKNSK